MASGARDSCSSPPSASRSWGAPLDRTECNRQVIEMARLIGEELRYFFIYLSFNVSAHSSSLRGPDPESVDTLLNWNVHEWEMP
jgi:hypothetical protein